jgi:hypothetical protein
MMQETLSAFREKRPPGFRLTADRKRGKAGESAGAFALIQRVKVRGQAKTEFGEGSTPMAKVLSEYCVYTIVHTDLLAEATRQGKTTTFRESKAWATGRQLWQQAQAAGVGFPVLLGDATNCSRLEYWGLLTAVEIEGEATRFTVDRVRPLPGSHAPQELVLRSTGEQIAPNFIRPYAICRTPAFLSALDPEPGDAPDRGRG